MENYEQLFKEISLIKTKYDELHRQTGRKFNLFQIIGVAEDERRICKIIAELLNPKGCHYQGAAYLKLFVENVLIGEKRFNADYFNNFDYDNAIVITEYTVKEKQGNGNYGFIDIVIKDSTKFIPIEVKINAADQEHQCFRYYTEASMYDKNTKVCYLTLNCHEPDGNSLCYTSNIKLNEDQYFCASFQEDILYWLNQCLKQNSTIRLAPIREILLQLISSLECVLGVNEEDVKMELKSLVGSSSSYMKSARDIVDCIKEVKVEMLKKVLFALEAEVDTIAYSKGFLKDTNNDYYKKEIDKLNGFYDAKNNYGSGFSYKMTDINKEYELYFRVDIEKDLAAGFCIFNSRENKLSIVDSGLLCEIKKYLKEIPLIIESVWVYYELLPDKNIEKALNFKDELNNDLYYSLYDNEKFHKLIDECTEAIKKIMDMYKSIY